MPYGNRIKICTIRAISVRCGIPPDKIPTANTFELGKGDYHRWHYHFLNVDWNFVCQCQIKIPLTDLWTCVRNGSVQLISVPGLDIRSTKFPRLLNTNVYSILPCIILTADKNLINIVNQDMLLSFQWRQAPLLGCPPNTTRRRQQYLKENIPNYLSCHYHFLNVDWNFVCQCQIKIPLTDLWTCVRNGSVQLISVPGLDIRSTKFPRLLNTNVYSILPCIILTADKNLINIVNQDMLLSFQWRQAPLLGCPPNTTRRRQQYLKENIPNYLSCH